MGKKTHLMMPTVTKMVKDEGDDGCDDDGGDEDRVRTGDGNSAWC